ncbi:MAG: IS1096 element passenger TnpR family protein [Candidatus Anammoxibacter sp.]
MVKQQSQGKCLLCNSMFGKSGITKHLKSCIQNSVNHEKTNNKKFFHIMVEGEERPEYWVHIKASANAKLNDLDGFLRNMWLECCGHMSAFEIQGIRYSSSPMGEYDEKSMSIKLGDALNSNTKIYYEYDFGSTTALTLKVVSEIEAEMKGKAIQLLARNESPLITCENCKNKATHVCAECIYSGEGWVCDECISNHECEEEMLLPVVNSPRVGTCGYTG